MNSHISCIDIISPQYDKMYGELKGSADLLKPPSIICVQINQTISPTALFWPT